MGGDTMLTIVGLLLVLMGFFVKSTGIKRQKKDQSLHYGIINDIKEKGDYFVLEVAYSPCNNETMSETTILTKRKPLKSTVVIKETGDNYTIYYGKQKVIALSALLFVVGMILCAVG